MSNQHDYERARTERFNARQQSSRYHVENEISPSGLGASPQVTRSRQGYGTGRDPYGQRSARPASRPSVNRTSRTHDVSPNRRNALPVSDQRASSYARGNYSSASRRGSAGQAPEQESYGKRDTMDFARRGNQGSRRYQDRTRYSANNRPQQQPVNKLKLILMGVAAVAVVAIGVGAFMHFAPVKVSVNGAEINVGGAKTVQAAFEESGVQVKPGNYVAIDDSVITEGKGNTFTCKLNDQEDVDPETKLSSGDVLEFTDGGNIMEEYDGVDTPIPWEARIEGTGALHKFVGKGVDGVSTEMVGKVSGKKATKVTTEPENVICRQYDADTKGEKVIALTIDDGPWEYTSAVLDVLKENGAKATFFVVGENIEQQAGGVDNVKRAMEEGHQICTHTFDHAAGSGQGVNITYMSADEQRQEIQKGYDAISAVTGQDASTVIRCPGGNLDAQTVLNLKDLVTAEIGWNIDTEDWRQPGSDAIYNAMMSSYPGAVILCHDGGGDRTQTVEGLRRAIPELIEQGYKFITVDEMLQYEEKAQG
ncbi:MAG: polysaccharide deacetylase family protein [Coriobacteriia bacterium]|nr:polysaccharide deacetylase family protein [Coriobacteriia bacterium]